MLISTAYDRMVALKDSELSFAEKSIYLYICEVCSWKKKRFSKKREATSEELNMPISTINKYMGTLERHGYIFRVAHYQNYNGKPYKTSFIYPLRYLEVIFNKCDIVAITKNAMEEAEDIKRHSNGELDNLLEILKENLKRFDV